MNGLVRMDVIANVLAVAISSASITVGIGAGRAHAVPTRARAREPGEEIFHTTCAGCHGADGRGADKYSVGFDVSPPDFTDCNFAVARELRLDAIVATGPVRGFTRIMPAFRYLLTPDR